jgi:hypothetical protein
MAKQAKKPFVLRMDPDTLKLLEKWAADEFRSLNGQIEYILHKSLRENGRTKKSAPGKSTEN